MGEIKYRQKHIEISNASVYKTVGAKLEKENHKILHIIYNIYVYMYTFRSREELGNQMTTYITPYKMYVAKGGRFIKHMRGIWKTPPSE